MFKAYIYNLYLNIIKHMIYTIRSFHDYTITSSTHVITSQHEYKTYRMIETGNE